MQIQEVPKGSKYYFVHLYNDFSGSPRVLSDMIGVVSGEKHIITSFGEGILSGAECVKYHNYKYTPRKNNILKLLSYITANIKIFLILLRLLAKSDNTSKVVVNTMLPFGALFATKLMRKESIVYLHETSIKPNCLKKCLCFCISTCADNIIYVSSFLKKSQPFPEVARTEIIYNPLSISLDGKGQYIDIGCKFESRNVIFLSSLLHYKGIQDYLKIAALSLQHNDKIVFNLVLNCPLEQFVIFKNETNIPVNVALYNRPKKLRELYSKSGFVLNLTNPDYWIETFGLTLTEGMSNGAIPIGPVVGGPAEIIKPSYGFILPHYEHALIRKTIVELFNDQDKFEIYSQNAREEAKKYTMTSYKHMVSKFLCNK